jgi:hypothetical protein
VNKTLEENKKCPKCSGKMVEGMFGHHPLDFSMGRPESTEWKGINFKTKPFKCEKCNYIEIYGIKD